MSDSEPAVGGEKADAGEIGQGDGHAPIVANKPAGQNGVDNGSFHPDGAI